MFAQGALNNIWLFLISSKNQGSLLASHTPPFRGSCSKCQRAQLFSKKWSKRSNGGHDPAVAQLDASTFFTSSLRTWRYCSWLWTAVSPMPLFLYFTRLLFLKARQTLAEMVPQAPLLSELEQSVSQTWIGVFPSVAAHIYWKICTRLSPGLTFFHHIVNSRDIHSFDGRQKCVLQKKLSPKSTGRSGEKDISTLVATYLPPQSSEFLPVRPTASAANNDDSGNHQDQRKTSMSTVNLEH